VLFLGSSIGARRNINANAVEKVMFGKFILDVINLGIEDINLGIEDINLVAESSVEGVELVAESGVEDINLVTENGEFTGEQISNLGEVGIRQLTDHTNDGKTKTEEEGKHPVRTTLRVGSSVNGTTSLIALRLLPRAVLPLTSRFLSLQHRILSVRVLSDATERKL
jgi:hypothetical protein